MERYSDESIDAYGELLQKIAPGDPRIARGMELAKKYGNESDPDFDRDMQNSISMNNTFEETAFAVAHAIFSHLRESASVPPPETQEPRA